MLNVWREVMANARNIGAADDGFTSTCNGALWPLWRGFLREV